MSKNIVRARVTIRGTRPLLQHAFGPESLPLEKGERAGVAGNDPTEWKKTCMVNANGQLYIKPTYVFGCVRDAAKHTKKGKGSIQAVVAATLQVEESVILIDRFLPEEEPTRDMDAPVYLDVCGVRNPSTKARNVRYRLACSPGWGCSFIQECWSSTMSINPSRPVKRNPSPRPRKPEICDDDGSEDYANEVAPKGSSTARPPNEAFLDKTNSQAWKTSASRLAGWTLKWISMFAKQWQSIKAEKGMPQPTTG